jgi:L-asparagine transporter-like permease
MGTFCAGRRWLFGLASGFHTTKLVDTLTPQHMPANGITFANVNIYCVKSLSALLKHFNTLREGHIDLEGNGDCYV